MQGPHDVGGRRGYGPLRHTPDEPTFHQVWEGHGFVLGLVSGVLSGTNTDAFRHSMERLSARDYLGLSYYGRWTHACATLLAEAGVLDRAELDTRVARVGAQAFPLPAPNPAHHRSPQPPTSPGITRPLDRPRRFADGDRVAVRCDDPPGHTRVAGYLRGRRGCVVACRPAGVWPDASAHGHGEDPQWLYAVRFDGVELWGADAEPGTSVTVDLFEPHLDPEEPR
jgi:nitrile hydratase subunit beta